MDVKGFQSIPSKTRKEVQVYQCVCTCMCLGTKTEKKGVFTQDNIYENNNNSVYFTEVYQTTSVLIHYQTTSVVSIKSVKKVTRGRKR